MLDLLDYRRRVAGTYNLIRSKGTSKPESFSAFRASRDELFAQHPQSPLDTEQKLSFTHLNYYPYNPAYRVLAEVQLLDAPLEYESDGGDDGAVKIRQIGTVDISLPHGSGSLGVFWIAGYGGGVFIPFRDATNGDSTYGAGRFLYSELPQGGKVELDFNQATNPFCAYTPYATCPLPPSQNRLDFRVEAGEKVYHNESD